MQSPHISNYDIWGVDDGAISIMIDEHPAMEWFAGDKPFWFEFDKHFNMIVGSSEERICLRSFPPKLAWLLEDVGSMMIIEVKDGEVCRCTPVMLRKLDIPRRAA